ncbi:MAG TPA: hypothetical protein DCQ06_01865, partial [Myxococcales bacterium]|nr:hypothetical protein [Myxococcales bacterium]
MGRLSAEALDEPIIIELTSPMLLAGQQINWTNKSLGSDPAKPGLSLKWPFGCELATGAKLRVGQIVDGESTACPCVCDVDGVA